MLTMFRMFCLSLVLIGFSAATAMAQTSPVTWKFTTEKGAQKGQYNIVMTATIGSGWAVYSQFIEEGGPVPTSIEFTELPAGAKLVGKAAEQGDKIEGQDAVFGMKLIKYKKSVRFVQTVTGKEGQKVKGKITFMCCNDESCLPPKDVPFEVTLRSKGR